MGSTSPPVWVPHPFGLIERVGYRAKLDRPLPPTQIRVPHVSPLRHGINQSSRLGAPSFQSHRKGGVSSEARPPSSPHTNPGAPCLASETWDQPPKIPRSRTERTSISPLTPFPA